MKYHVFFTTKYTDECLQNGKFGATSVNSLGTVINGDKAYLFDGLRWEIYGPFEIISTEQFYDNNPIYGKNKRDIVNYPNRVRFTTNEAKVLSLTEFFALEELGNTNFTINRVLQSVIIANKQIHSTPLTIQEGKYLDNKMETNGNELNITSIPDENTYNTVINNFIMQKKSRSEALFELLLLKRRYNADFFNLSDYDIVYNQFVLGFQRQVDILAIKEEECLLIEIKKKDNKSDPKPQIEEYIKYIKTDSRLKPFNLTKIKHYSILERGNKYIKRSENILQFEMTKNYELKISSA